MKHSIRDDVKVREEFMIEDYPNIWLEYIDSKSKKYLIGAFYRVWGKNQHKEMAEIVGSIDAAFEENRDTLIVADMNLNKLRFNDKDYPYKGLRDQLLNCLARNDLFAADLGPTYHSLTHNVSSELDHIMYSARMEGNISCSIHPSRATDHSPIVAEIGILKKI